MWKNLFKVNSSSNFGTMNHLFLRIGRLSYAKDPKKDMHASFDALMTVFKGHVVAAACVELGIDNPDGDLPLTAPVSSVQLSDVATKIVDNFTIVPEAVLGIPLPDCHDRVHNYARVLCHAASLAMEFTDAWGEGDGPRVLLCWKVQTDIKMLDLFTTVWAMHWRGW